jgi:hypothetical protein
LCEHVLRSGFSEVDVSDWVLVDGKLLARSAWLAVLADRCLPEFDLSPVWVAVDINVGDAHCCGWDVYIAWLLLDSGGVGMPKYVRS